MSYTDDKNVTHCLDGDDLNYLYIDFIKKAAESFKDDDVVIEAKRFDGSSGNFMKGIVRELHNADLVIAEITGLNPNVMYELGIRHTLKNNTIMIAQDNSQIPSDLAQYLTVIYKYSHETSEKEECCNDFERKLHKAIKERLEKENESDNPVRDFLEIKQIFKDEERINALTYYINVTELIIISLDVFIFNFTQAHLTATALDIFCRPIIPPKFEYFYLDLFKNNKDKKAGISFYSLSQSLTALEINVPIFLKAQSSGSLNVSTKELILFIDSEQVNICEIKPKNNQIINILENYIKEWEKELKELQA